MRNEFALTQKAFVASANGIYGRATDRHSRADVGRVGAAVICGAASLTRVNAARCCVGGVCRCGAVNRGCEPAGASSEALEDDLRDGVFACV